MGRQSPPGPTTPAPARAPRGARSRSEHRTAPPTSAAPHPPNTRQRPDVPRGTRGQSRHCCHKPPLPRHNELGGLRLSPGDGRGEAGSWGSGDEHAQPQHKPQFSFILFFNAIFFPLLIPLSFFFLKTYREGIFSCSSAASRHYFNSHLKLFCSAPNTSCCTYTRLPNDKINIDFKALPKTPGLQREAGPRAAAKAKPRDTGAPGAQLSPGLGWGAKLGRTLAARTPSSGR